MVIRHGAQKRLRTWELNPTVTWRRRGTSTSAAAVNGAVVTMVMVADTNANKIRAFILTTRTGGWYSFSSR